jgi:hypothetical protein
MDHGLGSKEPTAGGRGGETWVAGDQSNHAHASERFREQTPLGPALAEEIGDAELLTSCVVLVWRVVLAPPLLCFLLLL